jgi:hypothetical protein
MNSKITTGLFVAIVAVIGAAGGSLVSTLPTSAASTTSSGTDSATTAASTPTQPQGGIDTSKGGHVGANGKTEELLTGDTAEKARAAALAAVPGGTIQRVETDAEGATYEAHMTKSDGSQVTVKMDANFKVTGTETGGPGGPRGSNGSNTSTNTN